MSAEDLDVLEKEFPLEVIVHPDANDLQVNKQLSGESTKSIRKQGLADRGEDIYNQIEKYFPTEQ